MWYFWPKISRLHSNSFGVRISLLSRADRPPHHRKNLSVMINSCTFQLFYSLNIHFWHNVMSFISITEHWIAATVFVATIHFQFKHLQSQQKHRYYFVAKWNTFLCFDYKLHTLYSHTKFQIHKRQNRESEITNDTMAKRRRIKNLNENYHLWPGYVYSFLFFFFPFLLLLLFRIKHFISGVKSVLVPTAFTAFNKCDH